MEEKPNYFAVIPANVRYDKTLRANEKLLYGEITALAQKTGECWASNKYFSELYGVQINAVATWIKHLKEKEYIEIYYEYNGREIEKRIIKIGGIQKDTTSYPKRYGGGIQKDIDNNTSINNTSKKEIYKERFKKPTLQEVENYCRERNNNIDAKKFIDFYEVNNWVDSNGKKVKNWKQKIITWENHKPKTKAKEDIIPDWFNKDLSNPDLASASEMNRLLEEMQSE